jgi:undecaprenyl diphosphate synthase
MATDPTALPVSPAHRDRLPRHVAVIMDGNGRWAARRALPRHLGHRAGARAVREMVESCARRGIEALTLFAFSSENWNRPEDEVTRLMELFVESIDKEVPELDANGIRLRFIGERGQLRPALQQRLAEAERRTAGNTRMQLLVAVSYGGRWDIVQAARRLAERCVAGELAPAQIDEAAFAGALALGDVPDPDLFIRTGGEQRISNFLLWNLAYTELYVCDTAWPDFRDADLQRALDHYARRQRRFGRTSGQLDAGA